MLRRNDIFYYFDVREPLRFRDAKRSGGVVLALVGDGDCGHRIQVRVEFNGRDGPTIREAQRLGERRCVSLERMCPFCRTKQWFQLPFVPPSMDLPVPEQLPSWHTIISESCCNSLGLSDPLERMEAPADLAARWYAEAIQHKELGELDQAEVKLRDCIALCDHLRMTGERLTAISVLSSLFAVVKDTHEKE